MRGLAFNTEMITARRACLKTVTRRLVKERVDRNGFVQFKDGPINVNDPECVERCHVGKVGEELYVKETWAPCTARALRGHYHFKQDGSVGRQWHDNGGGRGWGRSGHTMGIADKDLIGVWVAKPERWRSPRFMPAEAARDWLKITDIRIERVADISEAQARAEGISEVAFYPDEGFPLSTGYMVGPNDGLGMLETTARRAFRRLWNEIHAGDRTKEWIVRGDDETVSSPWVWVVEHTAFGAYLGEA